MSPHCPCTAEVSNRGLLNPLLWFDHSFRYAVHENFLLAYLFVVLLASMLLSGREWFLRTMPPWKRYLISWWLMCLHVVNTRGYVWLFITKNFKCALQYCSSQLKCAFMNLTRTFGTVGFPDEVQTNTPFQWQYIRTDEQLPRLSATRNCELECSTRTKEFYLDSHQLQQPGSKAATPQVEWQIGLLFSVTLWLDGNLRLHRWSSCYYYRGRRANDCSMCVIFDLAGGQLIGKVSLNYCCCTIGET